MMKTYQAPWGKILKWTSAMLVVLAIAMCGGMSFLYAEVSNWAAFLACWGMPLVVLGCLPFVVRGYVITEDAILIRRLWWNTCLKRDDLKSAEVLPKAMNRSLRTCGNGGVFSFTGWYWSKSLGAYRAFVTDLNRTVVLRFEKKTVVVSPDQPEDFVRELMPS